MVSRHVLVAGLSALAASLAPLPAQAENSPATQVRPLWELMPRPATRTAPATKVAPLPATLPAALPAPATTTAPAPMPAASAPATATAPAILADPLLKVSHGSPWANFPIGAWVEIQRRRTAPDDNLDQREKHVLAAIRPGFGELAVHEMKGGKFSDPVSRGFSFAKAPSEFQLRLVSSSEDAVYVGGRKIACTAHVYTRTPSGPNDMAIDATFWATDAVSVPFRQLEGHGQNCAMPANVIKASYAMRLADRSYTFTAGVFDLQRKVKLGEKTLTAVVERGTIEDTDGARTSKLTFERILSAQVPGHVVKKTASGTVNGKPMAHVEEVLAWSAKP